MPATTPIPGTAGPDSLTGTAGDDSIVGLAGNDTLDGLAGDDILQGDEGFDYLIGGPGNDSLIGGGGDDAFEGGPGDDFIDGSAGGSLVWFHIATEVSSGVTVNLALGVSSGPLGNDTLVSVENAYGSYADDVLIGDAGNNVLSGGWGSDTIDGGAGVDQTSYADSTTAVSVNLATGQADIGSDHDTLIRIENVSGSQYGDALTGDANSNWLDGFFGNDTLTGAAGDDSLWGFSGDDLLDGGAGNDTLQGMGGSDTFVLATGGSDFIADFTAGSGGDLLDLRLLEGLFGYSGGDMFALGYARLGPPGGDILVQVDLDGAGGASSFQTIATLRLLPPNPNMLTSANIVGGWSPVSAPAVILGTSGNDVLSGGQGDDSIVGLAGTDALIGNAGNDTLIGGDGSDNLFGGPGSDSMDGGAGIDSLYYSSASAAVSVSLTTGLATGGDGNDTLVAIENVYGSSYDDVLTGDAGNNQLDGTGGNDTLSGGAGDDSLYPGPGNDALDGGTGTDTVYLTGASGVTADLATGLASGGGGNQTLAGVEGLVGTQYADLLSGDANYNFLFGADGSDTLFGGASGDRLYGGNDADMLDGGTGNDTLAGHQGADTFILSVGDNDVVTDFTAGAGGDLIDLRTFQGLAGYTSGDMFAQGYARLVQAVAGTYVLVDLDAGGSGATLQVIATLQGVTAAAVTSANIAGGWTPVSGPTASPLIFTGTSSDDILGGTEANDSITGLAGRDRLTGDGGNDTLLGGDGADNLIGGQGGDVLDGGPDINDAVYYWDATSGVTVNLATGAASGGGGNDTLAGIEHATGSPFNDTLTGDGGFNILVGQDGDDILSGGGDVDQLRGDAGNDTLLGGDGNDVFFGGPGNDSIDGGAGALDHISYLDATSGVILNLANGVANGSGNDTLAGIERVDGSQYNDVLTGDGGANQLAGWDGSDILSGGGDADMLWGGTGNDTLSGGGATDVIDGGSGADRVDYSGSRSQYTLAQVSGGYSVTDGTALRDGMDVVQNVESLRFADRNVDLTMASRLAGVAAADVKTLEELYVGFFNRVPEAAGLGYWLDQLKAGVSLQSIANQFHDAGVQFGNYPAAMTNQQFIREIYKNVLGRPPGVAPTDQEVAYWNDRLLSGQDTKGTMVLTMLHDVHMYFEGITDPNHPNYAYQFVAAHLNNKAAVAHYYAVQQGLSLNVQVDNIQFGIDLAALITPTDTSAAIALIGVEEFSTL